MKRLYLGTANTTRKKDILNRLINTNETLEEIHSKDIDVNHTVEDFKRVVVMWKKDKKLMSKIKSL